MYIAINISHPDSKGVGGLYENKIRDFEYFDKKKQKRCFKYNLNHELYFDITTLC